jgi:uncharacterized caspase-like protein
MLRSLFLIVLGCSLLVLTEPSRADKRVALVIGISNYQQVPRLNNPSRDAESMSALFKQAGFDLVDEERDVGIADLRRAIRDFSERSRDADIAVVYYAGHGIEVDGTNYLIPADAKLASDFDVEDETISLDRLLRSLDSVKRLRLIILDACRDDPFSNSMKKNFASRSIGRGLARIEPTTPNTIIAFATKAGAVADDGNGEHSQYASALVKYLTEPGVDLRLALGRVRDEVLRKTGNRQEPFVYGSLGGDNVALVPQPERPRQTETDTRVDYELAAQIGTKQVWQSFLADHATGFYANLARGQIDKIVAAERAQAAADSARREVEEQGAKNTEKLQKGIEQPIGGTAASKQPSAGLSRKELEEARAQADLAEQRAETARQELERSKHQAIEEAQRQVEESKGAAKEHVDTVAALEPGQTDQRTIQPSAPQMSQTDISRLLQAHLTRVGCNSGQIDGNWGDGSQHALALFNKNAKTSFDTKVASLEALDAVRNSPDRVCPLVCEKGERAAGDHCVEIGCASGYFLNSRGSCERRHETIRKLRTVTREPAARRRSSYLPVPSITSHSLSQPCTLDGGGHRENGGWRCRD